MAVPPLALDIDGTVTTASGSIDPRVFDALPAWDAPVVFVTGKSFPYPVALCHFLGIPERVVAENGGVVLIDEQVTFTGDRDRVQRAVAAFRERGGELGWGDADTVNRWRETEIAVSTESDGALLAAVAEEFDLQFLDTGYAYHLTDPAATKGSGLRAAADTLGLAPSAFVAVGDSENDVPAFAAAGESYAVANADEAARRAADTVLDAGYADGTLELLDTLHERHA